MAISDYLNGPKYRRRVQDLESQLADLQKRYAEMQALAKKYGAMDVLEIQRHIGHEHGNLEAVRLAIRSAERDVAALTHLELTLFHGHLIVMKEGVQDAQSKASVSGAISPANDRFSRHWAQPT